MDFSNLSVISVRGAKVRADGRDAARITMLPIPPRRSRASGNPGPQPLPWIPALRCAPAGMTKKSDCCTCVPGLLPLLLISAQTGVQDPALQRLSWPLASADIRQLIGIARLVSGRTLSRRFRGSPQNQRALSTRLRNGWPARKRRQLSRMIA
jgi:hypothetical protein